MFGRLTQGSACRATLGLNDKIPLGFTGDKTHWTNSCLRRNLRNMKKNGLQNAPFIIC